MTVPQGSGQFVLVPVTLPIGPNRAHLYMGFGDSITIGQGSSDELGLTCPEFRRLTSLQKQATAVRETGGERASVA